MIMYPLSTTERRIVRWFAPCVCLCMVAFVAMGIREILDCLEGLISLFVIGIDA